MNPLSAELETFQTLHPKLVENHLGQYVIVRERSVIAGYPSFTDALQVANKRFPDGRYMIQKVIEDDLTQLLAEEIANCPCCSGNAEVGTEPTMRAIGTGGKTFAVSMPFPPMGVPSFGGLPRAVRRQMEREVRRAAKRSRTVKRPKA